MSFNKNTKILLIVLFIVFILPLFIIGYTFAVMLLWNWLAPEIFEFQEISFWQALGLIALAKLLFGFGPGSKTCKHKRHKWKHRIKEKFDNMSEEDKSKFKEKWCGH